ncbi:MAG: tail fiber protein [Kiloniellales bacterium]|nr:tail fiber protein [Kiloniellales bacterium]
MSEPFIGEIRMFAGNFPPRSWAFCDGQLLAVSQNDALFSLLGTIYGGDGRNTFGLPDMRGRVPIHQGTGPGLSPRRLGEKGGAENVTLTVNELPSHGHPMRATADFADSQSPAGRVPARVTANFWTEDFDSDPMSSSAITNVGGSRPHSNMMPSLVISFIIALFGIYPSPT